MKMHKLFAMFTAAAVAFVGILYTASYAKDFTLEPPAKIVLTNDSDYNQPDNYRFRLRYGFEKGDNLLSIINMSENDRLREFGFELCEAQIQIDWSLDSDNDWKYSPLWDKMQGESGNFIWEYYKTEAELNKKKEDSRQILYLYNDSLPQWYDSVYGMSRWFSGLTYVKTNNVGKNVHYLDLAQHNIYTRSRFIVRFFSSDGSEKFITSDWSDVVGIGKGIEINPDDNSGGEKIYDAYGPLKVALNFETVSQWAVDDVNTANDNRIIPVEFEGVNMSESINRVAFAAAAVKLYENIYNMVSVPEDSNPFIDTDNKNALKAKKLGIINGVSENEFAPDSALTREEAAVILYRITAGKNVLNDGSANIFSDNDQISDWAKGAVYNMAFNNIIKGTENNTFCPKDRLTYEECVALCVRILNLCNL